MSISSKNRNINYIINYKIDSKYDDNYLLNNHSNILILINDTQNNKKIGLTLDNLSNYINHNF